MSAYTEDVITGACCSECGTYFKEEHGYPVLCWTCANAEGIPKGGIDPDTGLQRAIHRELRGPS